MVPTLLEHPDLMILYIISFLLCVLFHNDIAHQLYGVLVALLSPKSTPSRLSDDDTCSSDDDSVPLSEPCCMRQVQFTHVSVRDYPTIEYTNKVSRRLSYCMDWKYSHEATYTIDEFENNRPEHSKVRRRPLFRKVKLDRWSSSHNGLLKMNVSLSPPRRSPPASFVRLSIPQPYSRRRLSV